MRNGAGRNGNLPKVLLVSLTLVGDICKSEYGESFDCEKRPKSQKRAKK